MLEGIDYVPLLHTKRAEIRALKELEKAPRDRMFPILVARPGDHHDMENTWPIYTKAVGEYRYGLDIDRKKLGATKAEPARTQFDALFLPDNGFSNYYEKIAQLEGAIPVFRSVGGTYQDLDIQFDNAISLDRGIIIRIERDFTRNWIDVLTHEKFNYEDALIIIDAGWALDILQYEFWSSSIITQILDVAPEIEIVSVSSCFPNSFSHIDEKGIFSIDDRDLFTRLVRRHNAAKLKFGDWGSTRSASEQGGGKPWPRIDIAGIGDWTCFRQFGLEKGYQPVASRTVKDSLWASVPTCWGKNSVHLTSLGIPGKITGTELATTTRVNIHLTVQALGGLPAPIEETPYDDDF